MPDKPTPRPALPALVTRPDGAPPIVSPDLKVAFSVYNELARRLLLDLIPDDLTPDAVRAHIQAHVDEELAHLLATKAQATAIAHRDKMEKQCRTVRTQVVDAIDAAFPPGHPNRCAFFPAGTADHTLSQYMIALGSGMKVHRLKSLPAAITADSVLAMGYGLGAAETDVDGAKTSKGAASKTRGNYQPHTASLASRLSHVVRSYFGRSSKELAAFGLNVQTAPPSRKRTRAKATTPVAPLVVEPAEA